MAATSVAEELRRDHAALRRGVAALEVSVQAVGEGPHPDARGRAGALRAQLAEFGEGLERHFRREEEGLFPEAARVAMEGLPGADLIGRFLRDEADDDLQAHATLRKGLQTMLGLLAEAEAAGRLEEGLGRQLTSSFGLFRTVLELHAAKEDDLILPMIEAALSPSQREAVTERLGRVA